MYQAIEPTVNNVADARAVLEAKKLCINVTVQYTTAQAHEAIQQTSDDPAELEDVDAWR